jgi:hypothetical protein
MWGTSSPDDELTGDFGNTIEATQIAGRRLVWREIYHRAILGFCNTICQYATFALGPITSYLGGCDEYISEFLWPVDHHIVAAGHADVLPAPIIL